MSKTGSGAYKLLGEDVGQVTLMTGWPWGHGVFSMEPAWPSRCRVTELSLNDEVEPAMDKGAKVWREGSLSRIEL